MFTIPLFPWFGLKSDDTHSDTGEKVTVIEYTYGNSGYLHMLAESSFLFSDVEDEIEDLDGDVSMISLCFWLSLFFGIIAIGGVALYRTGKAQGTAHVMLLIGSIIIVFCIIALISHVTFFIHLGDFEDEFSDDSEITYGYNYFPLIFLIILLLASIAYIAIVVPFSKRALSQMTYGGGYADQYQYPKYQQQYPQYQQQVTQTPSYQYQQPSRQPPPRPSSLPTEVSCPTCKYVIAVKVDRLPKPIRCPQCGTRGFIE
ncbi:MAG: hypothetical protein JSW00_14200 [Thermoplasmata archaeon]|nr:MAG: hypothetical protein JSW00_14200 [Thermoplasmata archaeon]